MAIRTRSRTSRPDRREESPHLAFSAFGHDHFNPRIRSGSLRAECSSRPVLKLDADRQLLELFCGDVAVERRQVALGHAVTWMRDGMGELAVRGEDEQPTAVCVEPPDGDEPWMGSIRSITVRR